MIFFASNDTSDFPPFVKKSTTTGRYDANYVSSAILVEPIAANVATALPASTDYDMSGASEFWVHWDAYYDTYGIQLNSNVDGNLLVAINDQGDVVAEIDFLNGEAYVVAHGDTSVSTKISLLWPYLTLNTYDFRVSNSGGNITVELYIDGVSVGSAVAANTGGKTLPNSVRWDHYDFTSSSNQSVYMSQIMLADESTVGLKLVELTPNTIGAYSDVSNDPAPLADGNYGSGVVGDTAGQKMSWTLSAFGAPAPAAIHSLVLGTRLRVGQSGPQHIRHFLRTGATDYLAALDKGPNAVTKFGTVFDSWPTNPATGQPWTTADISSLEAGFEVKA